MATKTFEELKQMAIQIRDEKANKQNTATRIGTQMLEHLNKLEQEYYNKENIDEQKEQTDLKLSNLQQNTGVSSYPTFSQNELYPVGQIINYDDRLYEFTVEHAPGAWDNSHVKPSSVKNDTDKKFSELDNDIKLKSAQTKVYINPSATDAYNYYLAIDFFSEIIQGVVVFWDKDRVKDEGQKWAITYLLIQKENPDYENFDGLMILTEIKPDNSITNYAINIYDYGYVKGYEGILELNVSPIDNVAFFIILDCSKIKPDIIYKFGNTSDDPLLDKIYILPTLYKDYYGQKDSNFYRVITNIGKDFPISYDTGVEHVLNDFVLDAVIVSDKFLRINLAYTNRTYTNTEKYDNTIGFNIFDEDGNKLNDKVIYFFNDEAIAIGKTGILYRYYYIEDFNIYIKICWYLDNMPINNHSYGQQENDTYYNKIPFSHDVFIPSTLSKDSHYYKAKANSGRDFPVWISPELPRDNIAIKHLRQCVLDAEIITSDDPNKYTYELSYINRKETTETIYDNSVFLTRRERSDLENTEELVHIQNINDLKDGNVFWLTYKWDNAIIRIYIDASILPYYFYAISNLPSSIAAGGKQYFEKYCYKYIESDKNIDNYAPLIGTQLAKVVGENLYIGAKYNDSKDILIHFKKCMFNELMTFYKVGLANNLQPYPLKKVDRDIEESLNVAYSDNIGPIAVKYEDSEAEWCGGNHSYKDQRSVKTAENINYEFYADGIKLKDGEIVNAKSIEVRVKNRIYNPMIEPEDGATILSSELCIEDVIYRIKNSSIFVSVNLTFTNKDSIIVHTYHGLQSMFQNEDFVCTPNGAYNNFTSVDDIATFTKMDYPNFRRFVEKNSVNNTYQSSYLLPYFDGDHKLVVGDNDIIFQRGSGKSYHAIVRDYNVSEGTNISWCGLYNWFTALQDDENILVYTAEMQGKTYLFIDAKKAIAETYIKIPPQLTGQEYKIVEKSDTITIVGEIASAKGLKFASNNAGSLVISYNIVE